VPSRPLQYAERYTAKVTAVGARLHRETRTITFTTMGKPGRTAGTGLYMFDGQQYGVGMPVAVEFLQPVPENMRAAVQRRLFVQSDPPQPGAWHWFSGTAVEYRPAKYWQPGTKLSVRIALEGQPLGNGYFGDQDRTANASIAKDVVEMQITNHPKQLRMYKNGKLLRTMPVSLGKPSTPSSSGHMVIMDKAYHTTFDTRNDPLGGYVAEVDYAMRLTWGGEFIHSAPWSVGQQGNTNVSHGCVNLGPGNAAWLFEQSHVGDPVTVSGTEVKLAPGNGWTVWDMSWAEFVKGSAIPVSAAVGQAAAYDPYPRPTPAPSHS
jgi:lipoprotein-anchoring transpeptidase ErfK/SrfK